MKRKKKQTNFYTKVLGHHKTLEQLQCFLSQSLLNSISGVNTILVDDGGGERCLLFVPDSPMSVQMG